MSTTRLPPEWRVEHANPRRRDLAAVAGDPTLIDDGVRIEGTHTVDGPRAWIESDTTLPLIDLVDEPVDRSN